MKNSAQAFADKKNNSKNPSSASSILQSKEVQEFFTKLKSREVYPPKYPQLLKDDLKKHVRKCLQKNPGYDLKELVLQSVQALPDWAPPRLFVEAVSWVTEEWEAFRKNQESIHS